MGHVRNCDAIRWQIGRPPSGEAVTGADVRHSNHSHLYNGISFTVVRMLSTLPRRAGAERMRCCFGVLLMLVRRGQPLDPMHRALQFGGLQLLHQPPPASPPANLPVDPSDCLDTDPSCAEWASEGECDANPEYMKTSCPVSCDACASPRSFVGRLFGSSHRSEHSPLPATGMDRPCSDIPGEDCARRAKAGACDTNKTAMLITCPRSCRVCRFWDTLRNTYDCADKHPNCATWAVRCPYSPVRWDDGKAVAPHPTHAAQSRPVR
eukprot:scaffold2267_cov112-Isochrysis_galbana.AAC.4